MAKQITPATESQKWNFYFPKLLKVEMHKKLLDMGCQNRQSALLRVLVRMFVEGDIDEKKILEHIDNEVYVTGTGKESKL